MRLVRPVDGTKEGAVDLEDRLVRPRELELDRVPVMLRAGQLLKAEGAEEGDVFVEVVDDELDVIDLRDHEGHLQL